MGKFVGAQATVTINGNVLYLISIETTADRKLANTTDNSSYDAGTGLLWPTQLPVQAPITFMIKGWYDQTVTGTAISNYLYTSAGPAPVVFTQATGNIYGHGNFDFSNFKQSLPVDDTVSFDLTLVSNGKFSYLT
jgi:hypothetical protein